MAFLVVDWVLYLEALLLLLLSVTSCLAVPILAKGSASVKAKTASAAATLPMALENPQKKGEERKGWAEE